MRIWSAVFFPSLLAGKFAKCEQMLLPEQIKKKMAHAFVKRPYLHTENFSSQTAFNIDCSDKIQENNNFPVLHFGV